MARFIPAKDPETGRYLAAVADAPPTSLRRAERQRSNPSNPSNPVIFGEDIEDLAWEAFGIGLVAAANDQLVTPFVNRMVHLQNDTAGKLVDAATTGGTALIASEAIGFVDSNIGRKVRRGGMLLAVARAVTAFLPGFSISAQFPIKFPSPGAPAVGAPTTAIPTGAVPTPGAPGAIVALPSGPDQTRYPPYSQYARGLASNLNAGL